jgi:TIR domain
MVQNALWSLWPYHSVNSSWVTEEAEIGMKDRRLIPVLIDAAQPPLGFAAIQSVDLTKWQAGEQSDAFGKLVKAIDNLADHGAK